ncbi:MAG TPA: hypothetical protein VFA29_03765 [Candidatus Baltobacteraceae bacterium]|nr:hypothetical protein [Candidatus Baltobacteraceae bacterium]
MSSAQGVFISTATAIPVADAYALPALETVLTELNKHPGSASLALNMQELHIPLQAMISVPVEAQASPDGGRHAWHLEIRAASRPQMYPTFEGRLRLAPAGERSSELQLDGRYQVPLGALGKALDSTFLRGAAHASVQRFVRELAHRVAMLARWARLS